MQFGGGVGVVKEFLLFTFVSGKGTSRLERVEGEGLENNGKEEGMEAAGPEVDPGEDEFGEGVVEEVEGEV